ncbi:MAG: hypothetical protein LUI87_02100 [Lachnospiraceae bacterium]|nr:hypothetical protein [Lachnospiraceae bacterium]
MNKATLYFSDKSMLEIHEGDLITPIVRNELEKSSASMAESVEVWNHTHNGLIPSIMDAFVAGDYFYLNHEYSTAYNSQAVVKIILS